MHNRFTTYKTTWFTRLLSVSKPSKSQGFNQRTGNKSNSVELFEHLGNVVLKTAILDDCVSVTSGTLDFSIGLTKLISLTRVPQWGVKNGTCHAKFTMFLVKESKPNVFFFLLSVFILAYRPSSGVALRARYSVYTDDL